MWKSFKDVIRQTFIALGIPITRNIQYDILTKRILSRELQPYSNCVDVGAHKGEILDLFLEFAPQGNHAAFEPIPHLYEQLQVTHGARVNVYPYALGSRTGYAIFNHVIDAPAYSGLQKRTYKQDNPQIENIEVEVRMLDDVLSNSSTRINLIKIDVEGGELDVLKGATALLRRDQPMLIFEFGKGASEFYGTMPHHMLELLEGVGYSMWTLNGFWKRASCITADELKSIYTTGSDYYFVAEPKK
jgi:FkbM family methyltransferase